VATDSEHSAHPDGPVVVFPFEVDQRYGWISRAFGVRPEHARLEVTGSRLSAVFGPWRVDTDIDNVAGVELSGPYATVKVLGPPHISLADRGLTFATNDRAGLCIRFDEPVAGLLPFGVRLHPSSTVTVAEPERVRDAIDRIVRAAAASGGRSGRAGSPGRARRPPGSDHQRAAGASGVTRRGARGGDGPNTTRNRVQIRSSERPDLHQVRTKT
jgi:hypothetical protein